MVSETILQTKKNTKTMKTKLDNLWLGFIFGLIVPIISVCGFFFLFIDNMTIREFFTRVVVIRLISQLISVCIIPNLLLFFVFIWTNRLLSARGVLMATLFSGVIMLITKFII